MLLFPMKWLQLAVGAAGVVALPTSLNFEAGLCPGSLLPALWSPSGLLQEGLVALVGGDKLLHCRCCVTVTAEDLIHWLISQWLYWAIPHPNFSSPERAPLNRKQLASEQRHEFKKRLRLSNFKSRSSPKFGEYREAFGSPLAVLSGVVPANRRTFPLLL